MNWGLGSQPSARTGIKHSLSQLQQVCCPHVAHGPRPGSKQAQATSLAALSYIPGGGLPIGRALLSEDAGISNSHCRPCTAHGRPSSISTSKTPGEVVEHCDGATVVATRLAATWALDNSDSGELACCVGESRPQPSASGSCVGPHHVSAHVPLVNTTSAFTHTRPPADRTAEASSSSSGDSVLLISTFRSFCSSAGRSKVASKNTEDCSNRHARGQAYHGRRASGSRDEAANADGDAGFLNAASDVDGATCDGDGVTTCKSSNGEEPVLLSMAASSLSVTAIRSSMVTPDPSTARVSAKGDAPETVPRQPLTLDGLRARTPSLATFDRSVLQHRLEVLGALLQLDGTASLMLCRVVPGLLLTDPATLRSSWARLCVALGGEDVTRHACTAAPLLLVLPSDRVPACITSLAAAAGMSRPQAAALVAEWPEIATHAPASLAAKLHGLQKLLGVDDADAGKPWASRRARSVLRAALRTAPRLVTFSTAALIRHHAKLSALLGADHLAAALRREPGLLLQRPETVAAKLTLLQQLMDCAQQPRAVAALVVRQPGVLRRSLAALSRGCRALSIWHLRGRDKLRMCLSRPALLTLPPIEVHGRCRWLRRLMLSNAYYHAALRRLPPSLVGVVVAALPQAWPRLQYLAESSQECRMHLIDAVECRQEDFAARFPEFSRWFQFKVKLMGAENPWRGTNRIRGFNNMRDKLIHGAPNQLNLRQRHQQGQRFVRRSQQQHHGASSVPVVLAEACEVRSGGSTVARPRRVLRQQLAATALLSSSQLLSLSEPRSSSMTPCSAAAVQAEGELPDTSPDLVALAPGDTEEGALSSQLLPPTRQRRRRPGPASDVAAAPVVVSEAAAAELPR